MSDEEAVEVDPATDEDTLEDAGAAESDSRTTDSEAPGSEENRSDGVILEETDSTAELVDRVADHDEALAADVESLAEEIERLDEELDSVAAERDEYESEVEEHEAEIEELTSKLARVRADFSNYKQRAKRKQEEIRERASESLVERIAPVRNDLLRALDQDDGSDIRPGVESTLEKFDEVLAEEGVEPIDPEPGTEVDPQRHQVMLRVDSDQPDGTIHDVYEPGYEMGDRVITEAQVTVSDGE